MYILGETIMKYWLSGVFELILGMYVVNRMRSLCAILNYGERYVEKYID